MGMVIFLSSVASLGEKFCRVTNSNGISALNAVLIKRKKKRREYKSKHENDELNQELCCCFLGNTPSCWKLDEKIHTIIKYLCWVAEWEKLFRLPCSKYKSPIHFPHIYNDKWLTVGDFPWLGWTLNSNSWFIGTKDEQLHWKMSGSLIKKIPTLSWCIERL